MRNYILPVCLGAIFTSLTYSWYQKILKIFKSPSLSSLLCIFSGIMLIVFPIGAILLLAYFEASSFFSQLEIHKISSQINGIYQSLTMNPPQILSDAMNNFGVDLQHFNIQDYSDKYLKALKSVVGYLFAGGKAFSKNLFSASFGIIICLLSMFYFYIDGEKFIKKLIYLSPLKDSHDTEILNQLTSTTKATLKGAVLIGCIQGFLGGLVFWIAGLSNPFFWGVIMTLFSIIPGVGTALILLPAACITLAQGSYFSGTFILICTVIISVMDNIIRPKLIGKDLKMHDLLILLSTIGGITQFGIIGFLLGPIIVSIFLTTLKIYHQAYQKQLALNDDSP